MTNSCTHSVLYSCLYNVKCQKYKSAQHASCHLIVSPKPPEKQLPKKEVAHNNNCTNKIKCDDDNAAWWYVVFMCAVPFFDVEKIKLDKLKAHSEN